MMKVRLNHPDREIELQGSKRVRDLLRELKLVAEAHLVIRDGDLMTEDEMVADRDTIEIRPVISGGAHEKRQPSFVSRQSAEPSSR